MVKMINKTNLILEKLKREGPLTQTFCRQQLQMMGSVGFQSLTKRGLVVNWKIRLVVLGLQCKKNQCLLRYYKKMEGRYKQYLLLKQIKYNKTNKFHYQLLKRL